MRYLSPPTTAMEERSPFTWAYHRPAQPAPLWSGGQQKQDKAPWGSVAKFGGAVVGIGALGFVPVGQKRIWDSYLHAMRAFEEVSPAKMFRTFQYSEMFSPLGTHRTFDISPELFSYQIQRGGKTVTVANRSMREFIANMMNKPMAEVERLGVFSKGLSFKRTGWMFGELAVKGGPVISNAAIPMMAGGHAGGSFIDWWARASGAELGLTESVARTSSPGMMAVMAPKVDKVLGIPLSETAQFYMQRARVAGRFARAYWAGQIGRLNRLLHTPAEWFPAFGKTLEQAGIKTLSVRPGTATQMLWRYTAKGMALAGAVAGLGYLSYMRKESEGKVAPGMFGALLGGAIGGIAKGSTKSMLIGAALGAVVGVAPLFDKGIIEGGATAVTRTNLAYAAASQRLGLTESAKEQEALMPGITRAKTVLGLTTAGMMVGLIGGYTAKLGRFAKQGIEATNEFITKQNTLIAEKAAAIRAGSGGAKGLRAFMSEKFAIGSQGSAVNKIMMRGGWMGALAGAGAFAALAFGAAWATGNLLPGILGSKYTPEELQAMYEGKKEVPVRQGRWWEFGRSSWEGGRVDYYRPHWYHLMTTKAKIKGLYGSEAERWESSPMAHPMKALFDKDFKYRWEMKHYYERPYPMTGTYFEDVPFLGPLASATLGKAIKPPMLMHTEEWLQAPGLTAARSGAGTVKHVPTAGESSAAPELGGELSGVPVSKFGPTQTLGESIYRINELRGLTGFIHNAIKEQVTGRQDYFDQLEQLETASRAYGAERAYWDLELGGLLGSTEAYRRFLPHRRRQIQQYNPIRNLMPEWLPGPEYYQDFLHGDPYARVKEGEIRLPGAGYEALHPELIGVAPEEYPVFHKYKILADVGMYSDKFKQTRIELKRAIKRGELSEDQINQVDEINRQVSERKARKRFMEYKFSEDALEPMKVTVKGQIDPLTYETEEAGRIQLAGVDIRGEKGTETYRRRQALVSDYLREYAYPGAELDIFVHKDQLQRYKGGKGNYYQPAVIRAGGVSLGRELVGMGLADYSTDSLAAFTRFDPVQRKIGRAWELFTHYESPREYLLPLSPKAKFIHQRSAIEEYERTRVWGTEAAFWQHPVQHFIKPAAQMTARMAGSSEIPESVRTRRAIEDYFDKLKWVKYKALGQAARNANDEEAIKEFGAQQRRTLFGVNPYGSQSYVYSAMPSLDRDYYENFVEVDTPEDRERILEILPKNQHALYLARWSNQLATSIQARKDSGQINGAQAEAQLRMLNKFRYSEGRKISPELQSEYEQEKQPGENYADWSRSKELKDYFTNTAPLPGANWVGWHPHVDLEDIKLTIVENLGQNMHDYNLWPSRKQSLVNKPYINQDTPLAEDLEHRNPLDIVKAVESTMRNTLRLSNVQVKVLPAGKSEGDTYSIQIQDDRQEAINAYKADDEFMEMI